jgi:hypothetical protein
MNNGNSAVGRHGLLLVAATLAAQGNAYSKGFRQRDVRRMIEFSANWAYPEFDEGGIPLDNTQIRRYLEWLVAEGFARKTEKGTHPKYELTRHGIIELASSVGSKRYHHNRDEFFYVYFILADYRRRITATIERVGRRFPYAFRLEFESLLDSKALVTNQIYHARRELLKLNKRIQEALEAAEFVEKLVKEGTPFETLAAGVEKRFPFSLNSAMPISQFLPALTPKQAIWELTVGSRKRCMHLWTPKKDALELHIAQLERLLVEENAVS